MRKQIIASTALACMVAFVVARAGATDLVAYDPKNFPLQAANTVIAGPSSGGSAAPGARTLVAADIPALDTSKITTGNLPVSVGGTGLTSYTVGDIPYASASQSIAKLAATTAGLALTANGASTAPVYSAGVQSLWGGTINYVLTSNGPGTQPTYQATASSITQATAKLSLTGNQSLTNNSIQTVLFGAGTETWVNGVTHSTSTNTGRLTIVTAGKYTVHANGAFSANNPNAGVRRVTINQFNASNVSLSSSTCEIIAPVIGEGNEPSWVSVSDIFSAAATDYFTMTVIHDQGASAVNLSAGSCLSLSILPGQ